MAEQRKDIATRLKDLREIEGKTAEEMAAALHLPLAEYGAFEAGTADIPASALHDAARLLKEAAKKYPDSDVLAGAVKKFAP